MASMGKSETKISELCKEFGISRQTFYRRVSVNGEACPDGVRVLSRKERRGLPWNVLEPRTATGPARVLPGTARRGDDRQTFGNWDGRTVDKHDGTCLMTARCASGTNPVEPGTASVIPPTMGAHFAH